MHCRSRGCGMEKTHGFARRSNASEFGASRASKWLPATSTRNNIRNRLPRYLAGLLPARTLAYRRLPVIPRAWVTVTRFQRDEKLGPRAQRRRRRRGRLGRYCIPRSSPLSSPSSRPTRPGCKPNSPNVSIRTRNVKLSCREKLYSYTRCRVASSGLSIRWNSHQLAVLACRDRYCIPAIPISLNLARWD